MQSVNYQNSKQIHVADAKNGRTCAVSLGLSSDCITKLRKSFKANLKPKQMQITFDTQVKTRNVSRETITWNGESRST